MTVKKFSEKYFGGSPNKFYMENNYSEQVYYKIDTIVTGKGP